MCMRSDFQLVYMVPRNSIQLLYIGTTKFQVEREPVYKLVAANIIHTVVINKIIKIPFSDIIFHIQIDYSQSVHWDVLH